MRVSEILPTCVPPRSVKPRCDEPGQGLMERSSATPRDADAQRPVDDPGAASASTKSGIEKPHQSRSQRPAHYDTSTSAVRRVETLRRQLTRSGGTVFTPDQVAAYHRDGYVVLPALLSKSKCARFRDHFASIASLSDADIRDLDYLVMRDVSLAKGRASAHVEGFNPRTITKLQHWVNDEVFFSYSSDPLVTRAVAELVGSPHMKSMFYMYINKPPDTGGQSSRHPMHQDAYYFPFKPTKHIVASWTALQRIDRSNGCLSVVPGSHRDFELLPHGYPADWEGAVNKFYWGVQVPEAVRARRVHLEMNEGDTVFFHPLLIHGSGTNRSSGFRQAISTHFASTDIEFFNVMGTLQESGLREIAETVGLTQIEGLTDAELGQMYSAWWEMNSRQVC